MKRMVSLFFAVTLSMFASEATKKMLYSCKSGDAKAMERTLDSMLHVSNYYSKNGASSDIVMVAQGECVKFMLENSDGTEYQKEDIPLDIELKMEKLKGKARFEQCAVTLERKHIERSKVKKSVKVVPSATVSIVDYQLAGYALVP